MNRFATSLVFSVLMIVALAGPAPAAEQVPFKGSLDGDVTVTPIDPPVVFVEIDGGGTANHLGKFSVYIPHIVDRGTRIGIGTYEFVAANGDTLVADFVGQSSMTELPGVLFIEEVATITGGTGRFAGATGSFTVERYFDTLTGETFGSFTGFVSSPGKNK